MTDRPHIDLWLWLGGVLAGLVAWWLGWPWPYQTFAVALVMDVATGLLAGGKEGALDSEISYRGMRKKAMEGCLVGFAAWIGTNPTQPLPLGEMAAMGFVVTEITSIAENALRLGVKFPEPVAAMFKRYVATSAPPTHDER